MISRKRLGLRAITLLTACATLCLVIDQASYADAPQATVQFHLLDVPSGKLAPAVVCIRNLDDKSVHLPPDGRVMQRVSQTEEFYRGVVFEADNPDWIGPIRKTLGKGDNNDRSYVYDELRSIPFWREPVLYQTQPSFSIKLEPGRYQISAARGMEYIPVTREFAVSAQDQEHTLRLERWVDLPARGWFSGDVHVHHPTTKKTHREFLLRYAEAEDLHVVNVLEMGHHRGTDFKQLGFGKKFRQRRGDYCLVSGQEEPRSTFGHIIGLNTSALARDLATYDLYDLAFKRLHAQRDAVVGFAHFSWNGCDRPRGFPWHVTTEGIDFVELCQLPGSEIKVDGKSSVRVRARAWGHEKVGLPQVLELVSNDGTLREVRRRNSNSNELSLEVEVDIPRSKWLAISTRCANGAVAHTTPVYVVVDEEPTWSPNKSSQIVRKQLDAIALIEEEFSKGSDIRSRSIRERLGRAKSYYAKLLAATAQSLRPK